MPDGGQCLPVFTAPVRAADYIDVCLNRAPRPQYFVQSATGLLRLLHDPGAAAIRSVTLDRCPRCQEFVRVETHSLKTSSDLITLWSICQATKLARIDLYVGYARKLAQGDLWEVARQVAFEAVAHVAVEDPRPHLLLGQLGVALGDKVTFREATAFLRLLKFDAWERQLNKDAASGSREFGTPEFFSNLQPETLWMPRV